LEEEQPLAGRRELGGEEQGQDYPRSIGGGGQALGTFWEGVGRLGLKKKAKIIFVFSFIISNV